ncbi:MAG TPA: two-component regulator propeller domain-containing protein, partial [Candidatus Acidoferrum sp.]|nr:two-component regulator propeller domain-containing protein [Candidatus Acidoferrum sp.]
MNRTDRWRTGVLGIATVAMIGMLCPGARGLNPALDVSQYVHTAWKIRDGFTKGAITSIAQTRDGYLWLGTEFGLLRFDGVRNVAWSPPDGQPLPDNNVQSLLAASDGTLWIGTTKGLASWKDGKLTQYPELADQPVVALLEDHEGTIWASSRAISLGNGKLCTIHSSQAKCFVQDMNVDFLYEDSRHNIWAAAANALWRCNPAPLERYPMPDPIMQTPQTMAEDEKGALLIATRNGIKRFVNGKTELYLLPGIRRDIKSDKLFRDRQGSLWIGTFGGGLFHLHQGRTDAFSQADGLSGNDPWGVFEDREGTIWVVTDGGLDRFRDFTVPTFSVKQGLPSSVAWSVLAAKDGSIWIGSPNGLAHWKEKQFTIYQKPGARAVSGDLGQRAGTVRRITDSGLPNGVAQSVAQDHKGRIWVTTSGGVAYFEKEQFISIKDVPTGSAYSVIEDNAGDFWVNHNQGLLHLSGEKIVETIPWTKLGHQGIAVTLAADRLQGGIWLGFFNGGLAYLRDGQVRASYSAADGLGKGH